MILELGKATVSRRNMFYYKKFNDLPFSRLKNPEKMANNNPNDREYLKKVRITRKICSSTSYIKTNRTTLFHNFLNKTLIYEQKS